MMKQINLKQKLNLLESNFLKTKAKEIRQHLLDMATRAKSSHIGSAFSIVDILTTLFHRFINIELIKKNKRDRDYFILSKGHSVSALYATLASVKLIRSEVLDNYYKNGTVLAGHPIKNSLLGIEASTGSLGHGLSLAVGIAIACKNENLKNKIYVLLGDGECQEGSVWEAISTAVRFKLNNLVIFVDQNKLQGLNRTEDVAEIDLTQKFSGFGCKCEKINGHDFLELEDAINLANKSNTPTVIVADTIKGKGVEFMQNKLEWHYKSPNEQEYEIAKKEILEK